MNTHEVETDTKIAEAYGELATASQKLGWAQDSVRRAAGQRQRNNRWDAGFLDAIAVMEAAFEANKFYLNGYQLTETVAKYNEAHAAHEVALAKYATLSALYTGWSRFFLVTNTNGHVHSSLNCSTCYATTTYAWLPNLSGLSEAEAVADQGEILCSVCFSSAPVAWTTGVSKASTEARGSRAAKSAALATRKAEKSLGTVLRVTRDRIETIAAAKMFLTDAAQWNAWTQSPTGYHPSFPPQDVALVAETLAERIGSTPEAEIEAAAKRAAKRK